MLVNYVDLSVVKVESMQKMLIYKRGRDESRNSSPEELMIMVLSHTSLDAIGYRSILRNTSQNRELAPCTTPYKLRVFDGGILDLSGLLHIVRSALSGLIVRREAPAIGLAVLGDHQAIIGSSRDMLAVDVGKNRRLHKEARFVVLIEEQILLVELGNFHATLGTVHPTPDEDLTRLGDGESMMGTTSNLLNIKFCEILNHCWGGDGVVLVVLILGNTSLAKSIETPRIDLAGLLDSKAVIIAAADFGDILALETELTGDKCADRSSRNNTTGKLVLLASSPCEDLALVIESEEVIGASGKCNDVLQLRN